MIRGCDASVHVVNMVIADAGDDFQLMAQDVHREILLGEEAELVHERHVFEGAFALGGEVGVDRAARRSLRIEDLAFAQVARGAVLAADDQPVVKVRPRSPAKLADSCAKVR